MDEACYNLWTAVLEQQIRDLSMRAYRQSAIEFFTCQKSSYTDICRLLDVCPYKLRNGLVQKGLL